MDGLKKVIRDVIPYPWEKVLRENRILLRYVDLVYTKLKQNVPGFGKMDNISHSCYIIRRILTERNELGESYSFLESIYYTSLNDVEKFFWKTINNKIQKEKENAN